MKIDIRKSNRKIYIAGLDKYKTNLVFIAKLPKFIRTYIVNRMFRKALTDNRPGAYRPGKGGIIYGTGFSEPASR